MQENVIEVKFFVEEISCTPRSRTARFLCIEHLQGKHPSVQPSELCF